MNVEQGLEDAGFSLTTKAWMDTYDTQVETARMGYFGELQQEMAAKGMAAVMKIFTEPFVEPAISGVSQKEIDAMKADLAIYVLSRNSGEGKDRTPGAGDYELSDTEKLQLQILPTPTGI